MGANDKVAATFHGADPLDQIRARLEAATPGPWECDGFADGDYVNLSIYEGTNQGKVLTAGITTHGNADLFMNAREDIRRLLNALEAVRAVHTRTCEGSGANCIEPDCPLLICGPCGELWPCPTIKAIDEQLGES